MQEAKPGFKGAEVSEAISDGQKFRIKKEGHLVSKSHSALEGAEALNHVTLEQESKRKCRYRDVGAHRTGDKRRNEGQLLRSKTQHHG